MAFRVGITGLPNTGKSFAWSFYKKGEEVFAICPSSKIVHVRDSQGNLPQRLDIAVEGKGNSMADVIRALGVTNQNEVVRSIVRGNAPTDKVKAKGNYVICSNVNYVGDYKRFISKYMPQIKIIVSPDFTHYISYIISSKVFMGMKTGGQAFERFWNMAADTLNNVLHTSDEIREDILDFTEFHAEYNEPLDLFTIYTPAGKMLTEKFKPETYFDIMLHTHVVPFEEEEDDSKRYKFVVNKQGKYDGRSIGLFSDISHKGMMPNDMNLVIERLRRYLQTIS